MSKRVSGRETVKDLTHKGEEMKAIPRGLNTELMHDFGTDSLGQDHLYTAVILSRSGIAGMHALWPILCRFPGLDGNTKTDVTKVLKHKTSKQPIPLCVFHLFFVLNKYRFLSGRMLLCLRVIHF